MKRFLKCIGFAALLAGLWKASYAVNACTKSDFWCYQSGPSQNIVTPGRLDASGNLTLLGESIWNPLVVTGVSSQSTISPSATYMQILSTGGPVLLGGPVNGGGGAPTYIAISTVSAVAGQLLFLYSTGTITGFQLSTGAAVGINTGVVGSANFLSGTFPKMLEFMYDAADAVWREVHN